MRIGAILFPGPGLGLESSQGLDGFSLAPLPYNIYIHIPKYNLLSFSTVVCMCVFRADHLALDNQLLGSSLGCLLGSQVYSVSCL